VSVTRRNRGNDRSDCQLSGVAEAAEQQRGAEGSDMSDTWSVDSVSRSSLFLSLSSSSELSPNVITPDLSVRDISGRISFPGSQKTSFPSQKIIQKIFMHVL